MIVLKRIIKNNLDQIRYIISGSFFTLVGPSSFILISSFIPAQVAILFSELLINFIRFQVITRWVFKTRVNSKSVRAYIKATMPLFICNFILVSILVPLFGKIMVALIIGIFSATIGFIWNKICYAKNK